jgi:hypothetical protein
MGGSLRQKGDNTLSKGAKQRSVPQKQLSFFYNFLSSSRRNAFIHRHFYSHFEVIILCNNVD